MTHRLNGKESRNSAREVNDPNDPNLLERPEDPTLTYSLEELEEITSDLRKQQDLQARDTAHTDGSTTDPHQAQEQGLVYDPPSDPPVLPSDDLQGVEIAAGFAPSMEASDPDVIDLPDRVDNQDLDLEEDIRTALRYNSETSHLTDVEVMVRNGMAYLSGTVVSEDDIAIMQYLVRDLEGVRDVHNDLRIAGDFGDS